MTLQHAHLYERRIGRRHPLVDQIIWEPQSPRRLFRRASWEQATIIEVSVNGALVRAHANGGIRLGSRISIGLDQARGLVEVRRIEACADAKLSYYGVQFIWLDPELQARFDDAASTDKPIDLTWQ